MGLVLALIYVAGLIGMMMVDRYRVGVTQLGRLSSATILSSLPWFFTTIIKMFTWPVVLVIWLVQGRPASPWQATTSRSGVLTVRRRAA